MSKCCWLLSEPCVFPATYCGKKTSYKMVKDDDDNSVRKYNHLCDEHMAEAAKLPKDEEDDDLLAFREGVSAGFPLGVNSSQPLLPKDFAEAWDGSDAKKEVV
jgi:hypothetical protein